MVWQWYYHSTPLFYLGKRTVSTCVLQSTCIVHVINSNGFSLYTTTVYSRVSKENVNKFLWWSIPSINNISPCFGYIRAQIMFEVWCIICILSFIALNKNLICFIFKFNSNKASMNKCLCVKMAGGGMNDRL